MPILSSRRSVAIAIVLSMGAFGSGARAETGVSDTRIVVGQSAAFSGLAKGFGNHDRAGIELYFEQVNRPGGVYGRRLERVSRDDAYEPKRAAENTVEPIEEDHVFAPIGDVATGNLIPAMPIASSTAPVTTTARASSSWRCTSRRQPRR